MTSNNWTPGEIASRKHPNPKEKGFLLVQKWTDPNTGASEWRAIRTLHESAKIKNSSGGEFSV